MTEFRAVSGRLSVAGQIAPADVATAKRQGVALVINNRPEGESPDQPPGADIEAACRAAGVAYMALPIRGRPDSEQSAAMKAAIDGAGGPVLAFCRSGARSISAWALGEALAGGDRGAILAAAGGAGYDLSALLSG